MAVLAMITAILVLPEVTATAAMDCAKLAVGVVLPSLFPMLVLSSVLVSTGCRIKAWHHPLDLCHRPAVGVSGRRLGRGESLQAAEP